VADEVRSGIGWIASVANRTRHAWSAAVAVRPRLTRVFFAQPFGAPHNGQTVSSSTTVDRTADHDRSRPPRLGGTRGASRHATFSRHATRWRGRPCLCWECDYENFDLCGDVARAMDQAIRRSLVYLFCT